MASSPGDLVHGDIDGAVIVPQSAETEVIRCAWDNVHAEDIARAGRSASAAYRRRPRACRIFQPEGKFK